jgi:hypothetical protein
VSYEKINLIDEKLQTKVTNSFSKIHKNNKALQMLSNTEHVDYLFNSHPEIIEEQIELSKEITSELETTELNYDESLKKILLNQFEQDQENKKLIDIAKSTQQDLQHKISKYNNYIEDHDNSLNNPQHNADSLKYRLHAKTMQNDIEETTYLFQRQKNKIITIKKSKNESEKLEKLVSNVKEQIRFLKEATIKVQDFYKVTINDQNKIPCMQKINLFNELVEEFEKTYSKIGTFEERSPKKRPIKKLLFLKKEIQEESVDDLEDW